jgi:hypothetical protein
MKPMRIAVILAVILCAGCSASVHSVSAEQQEAQAYRTALIQPFNNLTAAASNAALVCAGGSQPNQQKCYLDTNAEIKSAREVARVFRTASVPQRYARANSDFLRGIEIFIEGLAQRNEGLAAGSEAEYAAGAKLVSQGLALQQRALSEYPAGARIEG